MIIIIKKLILTVAVLFIILIIVISSKEKDTNYFFSDEKVLVYLVSKKEIIELDLEEYVIGVVSAEMPALFEEEALKAQAILARTFVKYKMLNSTNEYHVKSNTDDQAYKTMEELKEKWGNNFESYYSKIKKCVNATKDLIVTNNDSVIKPYYYAISNGYTESSQTVFNEKRDYIKVIESSWDNKEISGYQKEVTFTYKDFLTKLGQSSKDIIIKNIKRNESNRVDSITINDKTYTGVEVRKTLSLRSTDFTIELINDKVIITTKGYGHGVGLSQYGANAMAKLNYNYEEIINYYYHNIEIKNINQV